MICLRINKEIILKVPQNSSFPGFYWSIMFTYWLNKFQIEEPWEYLTILRRILGHYNCFHVCMWPSVHLIRMLSKVFTSDLHQVEWAGKDWAADSCTSITWCKRGFFCTLFFHTVFSFTLFAGKKVVYIVTFSSCSNTLL